MQLKMMLFRFGSGMCNRQTVLQYCLSRLQKPIDTSGYFEVVPPSFARNRLCVLYTVDGQNTQKQEPRNILVTLLLQLLTIKRVGVTT